MMKYLNLLSAFYFLQYFIFDFESAKIFPAPFFQEEISYP